jgi:GT2 family glycosyltransferase
MPVYNTPPRFLRSAVRSVERQAYSNWELCIADDGSTDPATRQTLQELAAADPKIKLAMESHGGIAATTNAALRRAEGEFVAFLDHDDELEAEALQAYVAALNEDPDLDVLYSDEDKIDEAGRPSEPFFKPDWSPELLRGVMYVGHLLMARRALVEAVGGLDSAYDGVQDFELALRLSERTDRVRHVRRILYHWRRVPGSVAAATDAKAGLGERQVAAVNAHLRRAGVPAVARPHPRWPHRAMLEPGPRAVPWPPVSIIIPTRDAPVHIARCLDSLFSLTSYPDFEVIAVDNGTTDPTARAVLDKHRVTRVPFDEPFSFSRANNLGAARARGECLVLLNNDTEVLDPDWLQVLVFHLELPGVGVVGPLLSYPDGSVQHAGVALGLRGTADHVMRGLPADGDGYAGSLCCTREVAAVTGACLVTTRQHYLAMGGLNEYYRTHYQDVDFCLRTRRAGRRILYTPRTRLVHHESASRGSFYDHLDRALLLDAWGEVIARGDPFHDPRVPGYSA